MRSEKEMYDLILGYANADENIRAVILNGSRANPNRKPDPFNDFASMARRRIWAPVVGPSCPASSAKSSSLNASTKASFLKSTFPSSYAI